MDPQQTDAPAAVITRHRVHNGYTSMPSTAKYPSHINPIIGETRILLRKRPAGNSCLASLAHQPTKCISQPSHRSLHLPKSQETHVQSTTAVNAQSSKFCGIAANRVAAGSVQTHAGRRSLQKASVKNCMLIRQKSAILDAIREVHGNFVRCMELMPGPRGYLRPLFPVSGQFSEPHIPESEMFRLSVGKTLHRCS